MSGPVEALKKIIKEHGMNNVSKMFGMTRQRMTEVASGRAAMSVKIAAKLGYERIITWRKKL